MATNLGQSLNAEQRKQLTSLLEDLFERYRFYKTVSSAENFTGFDSDTEREERAEQLAFCERVERVVERLPEREREIIKPRYMKDDYVFSYQICQIELGISYDTYNRRRLNAFVKLADIFKLNYGPRPRRLELTKIG